MPDTYTQLRYHIVFSTRYRAPLITAEIRSALYDCIGRIIHTGGGVLLVAGGMPDHIHLLAGWKTSVSVARMLCLIKSNSSKWMNERPGTLPGSFAWQTGYGAFSVSSSKVKDIRDYILNQEYHHANMSFQEEFMGLLRRNGVAYDPQEFEDPPPPGADAPGYRGSPSGLS